MTDYIFIDHPVQLPQLPNLHSYIDNRPIMLTQLKSYHLSPNDKVVKYSKRQRKLPFPDTKRINRPKPTEKEYRVRRGIIQPGKFRRDMHRYF